MSSQSSPWPAALTSAGIAVVASVVLSFGLTSLTSPGGAVAGADGRDGAVGAAGVDGRDGADGADGRDGAVGPTGAAGADGVQGPAGAAGRDGADGADGAPGVPGPPGAAGRDAVVDYVEVGEVTGAYSAGISPAVWYATATIASDVAPGRYVLMMKISEIQADLGRIDWLMGVTCSLTNAVPSSTGNAMVGSYPTSAAWTVGPGTSHIIAGPTVMYAVDVPTQGAVGVRCRGLVYQPGARPALALHDVTALLMRAG